MRSIPKELIPMNRTALAAAALAALVGLSATACSGGGGQSVATTLAAPTTVAIPSTTAPSPTTTTAPAPTTVTIHPLFVRTGAGTAEGGVGQEIVTMEPTTDHSLRVDFSEDEVAGLGDQSRAASWNAVTVATLLTGAPLEGRYRFEIQGQIDGPSAGALKTVGVLSLMRGDTMKTGITMTGTINPDGTVGPVGGIPEKIAGAAKEGIKTVLIPAGQRNSASEADGSLVDVVDEGRRLGVAVREVRDVYEAYTAFTGAQLPRLPEQGDVRLDEKAYTRLKAKADAALARYQAAAGQFGALDPTVQDLLNQTGLPDEAASAADRASNLEVQGLQAGAFQSASQAAVLADATVATAQAVQVLLTQGSDAFFSQVSSSQAIEGEVFALLDTLKTDEPATVSDASALMLAYANAFDALSSSQFAAGQISSIQRAVASGSLTVDDAIPHLLVPLVYYELSGGVVDMARDVYDVGRDLGGPAIKSNVDLAAVADFFRKGSDANFAAFESNVVKELGNQAGMSEDDTLSRFADLDLDVALSVNQRNVLDGVKQYIGAGEPNAEYAQLGFAISNYTRNALLVEKYYANGQVDSNFQLAGVRSEVALSAALDLGRRQLAASVAGLRDKGIEPSLQVAAYELANTERELGLDDKFNALSSYWGGFLSARVLAYLGGFPTDGLGGTSAA
jgi:uncharacterized protein